METTKHLGISAALAALGLVLGQARPSVAQSGALQQLPRPAACTMENGDGINCADGVGLDGAFDPAVSADGKHVYVPGFYGNSLAVFARNTTTGELTQLPAPDGCLAEGGDGITCTPVVGLHGANSVVVSRDGKHVYVGSMASGIAVFARDKASGALAQLAGTDGCLLRDGGGGSGCADIVGPIGPTSLLLSPDGKHLYASALNGDAIGIFARDRTTGVLTQLAAPTGCVAENGDGVACTDAVGLDGADHMAVSKSGKQLYIASVNGDSVAVFARHRTTGVLTQFPAPDGCLAEHGDGITCTDAVGLDGARALAISKTGQQVYVVSQESSAIAIFARNLSTGALSQLPAPNGCLAMDGDGVTCGVVTSMYGPTSIELTKNGRHAYVAAVNSHAVVALARDKTTGALTQLAAPNGCVSATGDNVHCRPGLGMGGVYSLAKSDNDKSLYATSFSGDSIAVFARQK